MNRKYLALVLMGLVVVSLAISSRSMLTDDRGADHVFYGADVNHFLGEELTIGDFDGDGFEDMVSAIGWDDPTPGGWEFNTFSEAFACQEEYPGVVRMENGVDTIEVCFFGDPDEDPGQQAAWVAAGWTIIDTVFECGECLNAQWRAENQGAALVFMGGDWSGKGHNVDLANGGQDYFVAADDAGEHIYNGFAAGDINNNGADELVIGAPKRLAEFGSGSVYVVRDDSASVTWPSPPDTIRVPSDPLVTHVFKGQRYGDAFGKGVLVEDLNGDLKAEIIVAAPGYDGADSTREDSGAIYIFYSRNPQSLPATCDLSGDTTGTGAYLQVILGSESGHVGVTELEDRHEDGGKGGYDPVGLAVGDWDGDGHKDLAIGAGAAEGGYGAVYVIFGADPEDPVKLRPGNTIDLDSIPSSNIHRPDLRLTGGENSKFGAGVAFVDADGLRKSTGEAVGAKDDLLIGAPYKRLGGSSADWEYYGETYIVWGDDRSSLIGDGTRDSTEIDVVIKAANFDDQLGGHFTGNYDIDHDGINDVGIAGQDVIFVFFGDSSVVWPDTVDLATVLQTDPKIRFLQWTTEPPRPSSTTIRFSDLNGDNYHDIVFGGYDNPGYGGAQHAGRMWVTNGSDFWKNEDITTNTEWSGNVFVNGDINVASGKTLTIDPGTDVWIWPKDPDPSDDTGGSYPAHFDSTRIEFRVWGYLDVNGEAGDGNSVRFRAWNVEDTLSTNPYKWWGVHVHGTGGADINYAEFRNGGIAPATSITVKNTTIEYANVGVSITAGSATDSVYLENVTIRNCEFAGVRVSDGMTVELNNCKIEENPNYGVKVESGAWLYAKNGTSIANNDVGVYVIPEDSASARADIKNCTIAGNNIGVMVDSIQVTTTPGGKLTEGVMVRNSTIQDDSIGVYCYDGSDIRILANTIEDNYVGVFCLKNSDPRIKLTNEFTDNNIALKCDDSSDPLVRDNVFTSNNTAVSALDSSSPDLGVASTDPGNNSFVQSASYHVFNYTGGVTIGAEDNFWNITYGDCFPKSEKIYGSVDYDPSLCTDPNAFMITLPLADDLPSTFGLDQNFPNPFNPVTTVRYQVPKPGSQVRILLYNVLGQRVKTLVNEFKPPGYYDFVWDGTNDRGQSVASGVYFLSMRASGYFKTRKLVFMK